MEEGMEKLPLSNATRKPPVSALLLKVLVGSPASGNQPSCQSKAQLGRSWSNR